MRTFLVASLIFGFGAVANAASVAHLFKVVKPVNPENLIQVDVPINTTNANAGDFCRLGQLDFYYLMNGVTPKRSMIEGSIRKRFVTVSSNPQNKASCPSGEQPVGTSCQTKFIRMEEVGWVAHGLSDPSLVIKAVKSGGRCGVGAFLDLGSEVIIVKRVVARGERLSLNIFSASATIRIDSISIETADGKIVGPWKCQSKCVREVGM